MTTCVTSACRSSNAGNAPREVSILSNYNIGCAYDHPAHLHFYSAPDDGKLFPSNCYIGDMLYNKISAQIIMPYFKMYVRVGGENIYWCSVGNSLSSLQNLYHFH